LVSKKTIQKVLDALDGKGDLPNGWRIYPVSKSKEKDEKNDKET
jgi:hypothetical protein